MADKDALNFPQLDLEVCQLPSGEWIIASPNKPLTEDEAEQVVIAYAAIQELIAGPRESGA